MNGQTYYRHLSHIIPTLIIYLSNWVKCMPQTAQINNVCEPNARAVCADLKGRGDKSKTTMIDHCTNHHRSAFDRRPIEF